MHSTLRSLVVPLLLVVPLAAQSEFDTWTAYDTGSYPVAYFAHALAAGDMDGDLDVDLVTAMGFNSGWVTVARNRGDGSFLPPVSTGLSQMSEGVVLADVDKDGDLDVLASLGGSSGFGNTLALLRNQGNGSLAAPLALPAGGNGPTGLAAADFDGDGWVDLAVALYGFIGQGDKVVFLRNDGAGGWLPPQVVTLPKPASGNAAPYRLVTGDLNGDAQPDVVAACDANRLVVLVNQGGSFTAGPLVNAFVGAPTNVGIFPDAALADVEHDGDLDVFYTSTGSAGVMLLRNLGSGALGAPQSIPQPPFANGAMALEAGDLDGDGWVDVFTANGSSSGCVFTAGNGLGGFLPALELPAGEHPRDVRLADATGEGGLDALVLNRHSLDVTVHASGADPDTVFHVPQPAPVEPLSDSLDAADMDADGDLDVAVSWEYAGAGGASVLRGTGDGGFAPHVHYPGPKAAMDIHFRDLDGDADQDLMWATGNTAAPQDWHFRLNDGQGHFGATQTVPLDTCGNGDMDGFDMDHDGDIDVFVTDFLGCPGGMPSPWVWVSRNQGRATFDPPYVVAFLVDPGWVVHGDLDGDSHEDLVVSQPDFLGVRLGNGDGTFDTPIYSQTAWGPVGAAVGDLNLDGDLDVATANWAGDPQQVATVSLGRGDGSFKPPAKYLVSNSADFGGPTAIQAADVDDDSDLDLLVSNYGSHDVSFLRNEGDGTFEPQLKFGLGENPLDIQAGDLDLDGHVDLAGVVGRPPFALDSGVSVLLATGAAGPAWIPAGPGLAGSDGVPLLNGLGTLQAGSSFSLLVAGAAPLAPAFLVAGSSSLAQPFKGGVLVPQPEVLVALLTGASGSLLLTAQAPVALSGLDLWLQAWISDAVGVHGWSATQGLQASFP